MPDRSIKPTGVSLNIATEMDGLGHIKTMVARGSGYTILAPAAAIDYVERGELIMAPIVEPRLVRPVYLVRSARRPVSAATRAIETHCIRVIEDLVRRGIWQAEFPDSQSASL